MKFKKYKIGNLFISKNGDTDIKKEHINGLGIPVITSGVENSGILGSTDIKAKEIPANSITVDMFGNAFFRPFKYKMVTHARVFSLEFVGDIIDEKIGLYLVSQFYWFPKFFNYSDMCSFNKIKDLEIKLPSLDNDVQDSIYSPNGYFPDFDYMRERIEELERERIEELERERIEELEKYLKASDLDDYHLSNDDIVILSSPLFGKKNKSKDKKVMSQFRCGDLFDIHPTKTYKMNNHDLYKEAGDTPVLCNSSFNNGIGGFSNLKPTENGGIVTFSDTTTGVDTMFYQPYPFVGYSHVQGMYPKDETNWKEYQLRYFIATMQKASGSGWNYSLKFRRDLVLEMRPYLPIQTDENNNPIIDSEHKYHNKGYIPDWDYMKKYIKVIEKCVISDVVKYKDEFIENTKKVIA